MDLPSNPNSRENNGNRSTRIPDPNFHVNDQLTLTPAEIELMESMMGQPAPSGPLLQGGEYRSNNFMNLTSSEQDLPATNQTRAAAETKQMIRQQQSDQRPLLDRSPADSASVQPDKNKRKREADKKWRENKKRKVTELEEEAKSLREQLDVKNQRSETQQKELDKLGKMREKEQEQRKDMELKVTNLEAETKSLKAETKSLKEQLAVKNQRCKTQQKELDKLGQDFVELKKNYGKQKECNQALEAENRALKDKYIELLEKSNPLVVPVFGTYPSELGQQRVQTTNISSEWGLGYSGIESITTQGPDLGEHFGPGI